MREASASDRQYIAQCFVDTSLYLKSKASDIYIDGLPDIVDEMTLKLANSFINDLDAIALIVERKNKPVACIAARIENTSFDPSGIGAIGHIALCWVATEYRAQHIGKDLVQEVEDWLLSRGIHVVELSYLAQNTLAETAWSKIGYVPFRVSSHKVLGNA